MKIVFLSHTIRSSIFRVGSYYLSKRFADLGHEVMYISSPLSIAHVAYYKLGNNLIEFEERWRLRKGKIDEDKVYNHVPLLLFPYTDRKFFGSYTLYQNFNPNLSGTSRQIEKAGFSNPDLVIQDSLKLNFCKNFLSPDRWVYRATDLYAEMPDAPSSMQIAEKEAVNYADYVFATSEPLKRFLKETYGKEVHVLRNGVNYEHFSTLAKKPEEYRDITGPLCVYVGSMDNRFDHDLIIQLSKDTSLNIVLIGPLNSTIYEGYDNILCLGEIHPDNLPAYLQYANVGLLPFKSMPANHNRSPMKIYEYGASGLPVVSTRLDEVERRNSKFVYIAESGQEFVHLVQKAIENRGILSEMARLESKEYSWNKIAESFLSFIYSN